MICFITKLSEVVNAILNSSYAQKTLIIVTPDESGGYYDHVSTPPDSQADSKAYGPRIWFLALGHFVPSNYVSHVLMEHSSLIKFIEWNFLGGHTGQLGTRDAIVNNIGSILDKTKAGKIPPN